MGGDGYAEKIAFMVRTVLQMSGSLVVHSGYMMVELHGELDG